MLEIVGNLFANAVDKLFGAAVLALVLALARGSWNTIGRLRLGAGGIYATRTSGTAWLGQIDGDEKGPIRRILVVKQFGWDLRGREGGQGENAEWSLQARLTPDGFVQGQYTQRKPVTGISRGAFYLEQDRTEPRRFRGLWNGWNVTSREITSGTYEWVQVRQASWWRPVVPWRWPAPSQADLEAIASLAAADEGD